MNNELKKDRIIEAAGIVFSQKGFHQAKMDEIAQMAKVAKGTLYYNFSSKSKLFAATATQGLDQIMGKIQENLESELPFMEHFQLLVATLIRLYISNREVTRIFTNEMSSGIDDQVLLEIRSVREQFNAFVEEILNKGVEKGYLKPLSPRLSALSIIGIIDTLCAHYLETPDQDSVEDIIETAFTILAAGLVKT